MRKTRTVIGFLSVHAEIELCYLWKHIRFLEGILCYSSLNHNACSQLKDAKTYKESQANVLPLYTF